jgi:hypothetical protein
MDNRPATPGSHIDWAGDDDDTLPDLNDWGVNTSKFASGESETISPIILEGLKPLPDVSATATASPLRQVATLDNLPTVDIIKDDTTLLSVCEESTLTPSKPDEDQVTVSNMPASSKNLSQAKFESPELFPLKPKPVFAPIPSHRKPWHPSLPAKPPSASLVPRVNLRPVATPMRQSVFTKSTLSTHKESSLSKEVQRGSSAEEVAVEKSSTAPVSAEVVSVIAKPAEKLNTEEGNRRADSAESNTPPESPEPSPQKDSFDDDSNREGLEASIHASKTPASAESKLPQPTPRNGPYMKKEASNRHPPMPRNGDQFNHVNNLKQWTERGSSPRNQPSRHGAGSPNSRSRVSRPIITGDAMSRLARTIGQTNSAT